MSPGRHDTTEEERERRVREIRELRKLELEAELEEARLRLREVDRELAKADARRQFAVYRHEWLKMKLSESRDSAGETAAMVLHRLHGIEPIPGHCRGMS